MEKELSTKIANGGQLIESYGFRTSFFISLFEPVYVRVFEGTIIGHTGLLLVSTMTILLCLVLSLSEAPFLNASIV